MLQWRGGEKGEGRRTEKGEGRREKERREKERREKDLIPKQVFVLPAILFALEEELKLPAVGGEGPFALILVPSRELADQIYGIIEEYFEHLARCVGWRVERRVEGEWREGKGGWRGGRREDGRRESEGVRKGGTKEDRGGERGTPY
jgi:hypothetical protein